MPLQEAQGYEGDLASYAGTVLDVRASTHDFLFRRHLWHTLAFLALTVVLEIAAFLIAGTIVSLTSDQNANFLACVIVLAPFLIPLLGYWKVSSRMRRLFFTELAAALHFTYEPKGDVGTVSGNIFKRGYEDSISDVLSGTYQGAPIRLYNYSYTTGEGKTRERHYYIIGEITASGELPHFLVEPHQSISLLAIESAFTSLKKLDLEGDFGSKFDVYVPQGSEIEALQILEPDTMATLMDGFEGFGFESSNTKVYIFRSGQLANNRTELLSLLSLLERLYAKFIPELRLVGNEAIGTPEPARTAPRPVPQPPLPPLGGFGTNPSA